MPAGAKWFDFWTDEVHAGGQNITAAAPLETLPLFVRAGSVLPLTEAMQFVDEKPEAPYEIRVYPGADGEFSLYEDAGDGYDYETGACSVVKIFWHEAHRELRVAARAGNFPGQVAAREFRFVFILPSRRETVVRTYAGQEIRLKLA